MATYGYGKRPLWHWVLVYALIGGVIYAAVYFVFIAKKGGYSQGGYQAPAVIQTGAPAAAPETAQPQSERTVNLTSTGFAPATLTVRMGETVTWNNQSGRMANVSSDPHPTHEDYPPLNLGNFPDGGALTLTFNQRGTYYYHNHLDATEQGMVVVQ
jgi:plastocyanin